MVQIISYLVKIPHDKLLHFFCGTMIWTFGSMVSLEVGLIVTTVAAIAKEVYDEYKYKGACLADFLWTVTLPLVLYIKGVI